MRIHAALVVAPLSLVGLLGLVGCNNDSACTLGTAEGCGDGQVCEAFPGDELRCTTPLYVEGRVLDAISGDGIEDARVVALDANGGARSGVAFTDADGHYSLQVSIPRDDDGAPQDEAVTLRADADGYQSFPKPPRQALPIDLGAAMQASDRYTVMTATTDVALLPLASGGGARVSGTVQASEPGGVLVVAEQGGAAISTSITGSDGAFTLFNVPAGSTTVTGYRAGLYAPSVSVDQTADGVTGVVLSAATDQLATVSGQVNIVNAPGGSTTSVILVVASTFDETTARGETPAGLRVAPVSGAFSIPDVPPGRYAVLAAFENDGLVRDPDEGIAGTQIVFVDVAGSDQSISTSFKVTGALAVMSPGADGLEVVDHVPELAWEQDSSEDGYEVRVYDAFGNMVHEDTSLPAGSGSAPITYDLAGRVELMPGMIYQFRAWSFARGSRISATEDLRGVFQYQP
jgi:hypothetical protein